MIFRFDNYELNADNFDLACDGLLVRADPLVLRLLEALVQNAGQLVTKDELIERVWDGRSVSENVITVAMVRLRRLLKQGARDHEHIRNVRGRGYRFVRPVEALARAREPMPAHGNAPLLVGRDALMLRLRHALADAGRSLGSVAVLRGEPGIGKSRIVEQLAADATLSGCLTAWGHCQESGDTPPLWPCAELVRELVSQLPDDDETRAVTRAPELAWLTPRSSTNRETQPDRAGKPLAKYRVFAAILDVFRLAERRGPCLLVLEDLHRADAATMELLRFWVDTIGRSRILLLATLRSTERGPDVSRADLDYLLGHRNSARIALERLDLAAVTAYVSARVDDSDGRLSRAVFSKSEGNPFFMVELARQLQSMPTPDVDMLAVSSEALELVRPRLLALDRDSGGLLSRAAVIGRSFALALLSATLKEDAEVLMAKLDVAVASQVLSLAPDSRTTFVFGHELVRAALYDSLPPPTRRQLHLAVACALSRQQQTGGAAVSAALLAQHLRAALPEGSARQTVECCLAAAQDAADIFAYADGYRYLGYALEALSLVEDASPRLRLGILVRQALFARVAGLPAYEACTRELARLARQHNNGSALANAGLLLDLEPGFPAFAGARETLEDALGLLAPDDDAMRAAVLARLATNAPLAYDAAGSRAQLERARSLTGRCDSVLARYSALIGQLYIMGGPASESHASETLCELEELCRRHPRILSVPPILLELHRAVRGLQNGNDAQVGAALERAATQARLLGSREWTWHIERCQRLAQAHAEGVEEHRQALVELHARARRQHIIGSELLCLHDEVVVLHQTVSSVALRSTLKFDPGDPPSTWSLKVRALAQAGLYDEARSLLGVVPPERLEALPCDRDYLGTLGSLTRAALTLGARDYLSRLAPLLAPYPHHFSAHLSFFPESRVAVLLDEIARALALTRS